jgi:hypothetical protein
MSQVDFETFWPFEEEGRQANMSRWRRMGRLWLHNGVVQGVGEQFLARAYEPANQRFLVGTGAAFIEGFYGATANWTWVSCPGMDGMVKCRLDQNAQQVMICYEGGHAYHDDPWAAHGVVETPLYDVWPATDPRGWADRRLMVSPDVVEGLETIPGWVPMGRRYEVDGPAGPAEVALGSNAVQMNLSWMPGFAVGRSYRVAGYASVSAGTGWSNSWAHLRAMDGTTAVRDRAIARPIPSGPTQGWGEFVLDHVAADLQLCVQVWGGVGGGFGNLHFTVNSCRIEVTDLGV